VLKEGIRSGFECISFSGFGFLGVGGCRTVAESPGVVSGFDDMAMMSEPVKQSGGHFGIAEDTGPFAEAQAGSDDHAGVLIEFAEQMEQQGSAGRDKITPGGSVLNRNYPKKRGQI
jgi:hypothetical protein